jgi:uncharacterized damage-inducible protein DinB
MEITTIRSFTDFQDKVRARTDRLLDVVPPEQLDFAYLPGKFTIGDQIRHLAATIEHEIHHRGELYIYLNLIGVRTPPMFGLTAEEVQKASTP